ncbi:MAG TPA: ABC transporter substrate-binding protein, partial [Kofleriaceae bacterium]|nr:ABC transporter substrate-binding protein [Kofleriaceae bacterium]
MVRQVALPALLVAAWALSPGCGGCGMPQGDYFGTVDKDPDPSNFRWCNSGEPEYIDPALSTSTSGIPLVNSMWAGLAEVQQNGLPKLTIATSVERSPDLRRFVFHLRKDARWSNGRPITAHDFVYHAMRVLHPLTASRRAEILWRLKNGLLYTQNRVRVVLRDIGPFKKGDIVEVLGKDGKVAKDPSKLHLPDPNKRTSPQPLKLHDLGATDRDAYATVPAGEQVTIVELSPDRTSAYVFYGLGDGVYGWVPTSQLSGQPNGDVKFTVRAVPPEHIPGVDLPPAPDAPRPQATVAGRDLLMLPEVLGVSAPDDYTFVVEGWAPIHIIKDLAADPVFRPSPRKVVSRWPKRWSQPEHIVTSGPLHMVDWDVRD